MMDKVEGYIDNILEAKTNNGAAYSLLTDNMIYIVTNNTTLINTVSETQK